MLGDTAVAVHPEDERYRHLVGRELMLPVVDRLDPDRGRRRGGPGIRLGRGEGHARARPGRLRDRPAARPAGDRRHDPGGAHQPGGARAVPGTRPLRGARAGWWRSSRPPGCSRRSSRTGTRWATAIAAAPWSSPGSPTSGSCGWSRWPAPRWPGYRDGTLRFIPERRGDDYAQWLEGIRDWCISRQLWWGHRIPVWYCEADGCGRTTVSRTDLERLPRLRRPGAAGRGRARHLVLLLAGAVLQPGLARPHAPTSPRSIPATRWSPRPRSCSSGWRG